MTAWQITWFTLVCAAGATLLILPPGVAVAWVLARRRFPGRALLEAIVTLPLVVPPVATGLLLLMFFSRRGAIGRVLDRAGIEVVFTWKAVVLAMAVMGLPLLVRTARAGFEQVNTRYEQVAATLGARPARIFFTISLPLAWPAVLAGAVLAFARALGEFGATITFAGNFPGRTQTMPLAVYLALETRPEAGLALSLVLLAVSLAILAALRGRWLEAP